MKSRVALLCAGSVMLSGCGYRPAEVADPNAITLRAAVFDVANTLYATKRMTENRQQIGLYPAEATVEFNIASKSTENDTLKLDASAPTGFIFPIGLSASTGLSTEGSRGNKITITFKNIRDIKGITQREIDRCMRTPRPPNCPSVMFRPN